MPWRRQPSLILFSLDLVPPPPPIIDALRHMPWPMVPGAIAAFVGFILQFVIKSFVDPTRAAKSDSFLVRQNLSGFPPREVLTETGERVYWVMVGCMVVFVGSLVLSAILYWNHPQI